MTETRRRFCLENALAITCGGDGHGTFMTEVNGIAYGIGNVQVPVEHLALNGIWKDATRFKVK